MIANIIAAAIVALAAAIGAAEQTKTPELIPVVMAVSWYESRWTPDAAGDYGCSLGYNQFNRCGGLGRSFSREELLDGQNNMRLAMEYIHVHLAAGYNLKETLAPWSVRDSALELLERIPEDADAIEWARAVLE